MRSIRISRTYIGDWCNGNTGDSDSLAKSSILLSPVYGGYGLMVMTLHCGCKDESSILSSHPYDVLRFGVMAAFQTLTLEVTSSSLATVVVSL